MKTFLTITSFLFLMQFSKAQDTTLPQGKSNIYLRTEKTLKHIQLWKIDSLKVEYVKDGNLGDVKIPEVEKIETNDYLITFDDRNKILKRQYDFIIDFWGDTVSVIIQKTTDVAIWYFPVGSQRKVYNRLRDIKGYVNMQPKGSLPEQNELKTNSDTGNTAFKKDTVKAENKPGVIKDSVSKKTSVGLNKKENASKKTQAELYTMGKADGKKYFKGGGAIAGGVISGVFFPVGWASASIISVIPPQNLYNPENPNSGLLYTNADYHAGFKHGAYNKKFGKTWAGFGIGISLTFLLVLATSN